MLQFLSHYNVRTRKTTETRDFYVKVLGLREGPRPQFPFPGHWMYCGEADVLHIAGIVDGDPGLQQYLGERGGEAELTGGGAIDHVAFTAKDAVAMAKHFVANSVAARHRRVPNMDLYQIFLEDPNGITIELNFPGENPPADIPGA
jgi:catechol 2,3-dioxygenase-like lactoylglutathione lyase family enzyme